MPTETSAATQHVALHIRSGQGTAHGDLRSNERPASIPSSPPPASGGGLGDVNVRPSAERHAPNFCQRAIQCLATTAADLGCLIVSVAGCGASVGGVCAGAMYGVAYAYSGGDEDYSLGAATYAGAIGAGVGIGLGMITGCAFITRDRS